MIRYPVVAFLEVGLSELGNGPELIWHVLEAQLQLKYAFLFEPFL